ncbi:uncharacterized protein LOC125680654 [Ostrea edulis]|uniref:uncharacterized protein LOC125680654 n=1 Tax=Ostrea edulis TaxID=37623 RepID=UPI0020940E86|nr:uncharacterized protein LOC125680654 [Ostrea edulis]
MTSLSLFVILISVCLSLVVIDAQNNENRSRPIRRRENEPKESKRHDNLAGTATSKSLQQRETKRIRPTTPRVVFPERLILRGENGKTGWQSQNRVAAILCWYCITTRSPQYCITQCHRHWLK